MEVRNESSRRIGGLAIPIGVPFELVPKLREMFLPGSINYHERGVRLLKFHNPADVLCSTNNGKLTLELREDGLYFEAELPNTTLGNDCLELVRTGELNATSPGFVCDTSKWEYRNDFDLRQIVKARVAEISLTNIPAYPATYVEQRNESLDSQLPEQINGRKEVLASIRKRQEFTARQTFLEQLKK